MIASLLGFSAALSWGASDFTSGNISRRIGALRTTLYAEVIGLFFIFVALLVIPSPKITWVDWLWCGIGGAIGSLAMVFFNIALTQGPMSTSAPISAVTATALPVLIGIITSGLPGVTALIGFGLALAAIWLISQSGTSSATKLSLTKLKMPLLAGIGFGIYFVFIHQGSQDSTLWPMVASRLGGTIILLVFALGSHQTKLPPKALWGMIILNTVLDISGNAFYILCGQHGRMDIAVVLSSLYPGFTVILSWLILHEHISRWQLAGILLALVAISLLVI